MGNEKSIYHIRDKNNNTIINNIELSCNDCLKGDNSNLRCGNKKLIHLNSKDYNGFICIPKKLNNKQRKLMGEIFLITMPFIENLVVQNEKFILNEYKNNSENILHNIRSLNGKNIQEIFSFISEDNLTNDYEIQYNNIKNQLHNNYDGAIKLILRVLKNERALKRELSVYDLLNDNYKIIKPIKHNLKKVILLTYHTFALELKNKKITLAIEDKNNIFANIDYDTFSVAIYNIIENATKYIMNKSSLCIKIEQINDIINITFDMTSLKIEDDEIQNLFIEGYKGKLAKRFNYPGRGHGMYLIRKFLEFNNGIIKVDIDNGNTIIDKENKIYGKNKFILSLNQNCLN